MNMQPGGFKTHKGIAKPSEDDVQIGVATFFHELEARTDSFTFFHVPNGGKRPRKTAIRMKRMGQRAGVNDLIFVLLGRVVWVELKLPGEKPNENQREFHAKLFRLEQHNYVVQAATSTEAVNQILEILFRHGLKGVRA
jgi:hypothetical protein